jgi:hypothetical protein
MKPNQTDKQAGVRDSTSELNEDIGGRGGATSGDQAADRVLLPSNPAHEIEVRRSMCTLVCTLNGPQVAGAVAKGNGELLAETLAAKLAYSISTFQTLHGT